MTARALPAKIPSRAIRLRNKSGRQLEQRRQSRPCVGAHCFYLLIRIQDGRVIALEHKTNLSQRPFGFRPRPPHGVLTQLGDAQRSIIRQNLRDRVAASRGFLLDDVENFHIKKRGLAPPLSLLPATTTASIFRRGFNDRLAFQRDPINNFHNRIECASVDFMRVML